MKRIFAVTHTEAEHHIQRIGGGWYDSQLTEKGVSDAKHIACNLRTELADSSPMIFSSDLRRCRQVAEVISQTFGRPFQQDKRLREMNYGAAGGKSQTWQEAHIKRLPTDGDLLNHRVFEGAETKNEVGQRMTSFVGDVLDKASGDLIIVTHGFALTFLILAWMKIPVAHMDHGHFRPRPGRVTCLAYEEAFESRSLIFYGSEKYLMPPQG